MRKGKRRKLKLKNKKVINATSKLYDGIQFRSLLEVYCYRKLKENNLTGFKYEEIVYEIIEGFEYNGEKIRPIKAVPDFIDERNRIIIEIKGFETDVSKIKRKLLKRFLRINNLNFTIYLLKNQKEVNEAIDKIKRTLNGRKKRSKIPDILV